MDLAAAVAELKRSTDTFGPFIRAQAERISDRIALRFEDDTVTYGAYDRAVNRMAARLGREGVARGTPVAILAPNSPLFLVALGAVAKLGAIGALINTHVTGAGLTHVLGASGAAIGVSDAAALPALDLVAGRHPVRFLADAPPGTALPRDVRPLEGWRDGPAAPDPDIPDVRGGDVFLYIYTSGTTGYPKPAIVRHLRFTMGGITLAGLLGVEAGETIYAPLPLYHGESLFVGFAPAFRAGGAFASRRRFSASAFLDDVRRHQAVAFVYVGELCRYLLRLPPTPRDRDHRLRVAAGAGLRPDIWSAFQERFGIARIIEMYGATEGNVALHNADGYYYFVDRIGDTFRWKGENVATQEVADVLGGAAGVTEVNVYGVEVPGEDGRAGMAALVLAEGARFDGAALYARAEQHLPAYARPAFVRLVPEMDVTGTLKQRKLALAAEGYDPARAGDPLFVRDDAACAYVPLTTAVLAAIRDGRRRL